MNFLQNKVPNNKWLASEKHLLIKQKLKPVVFPIDQEVKDNMYKMIDYVRMSQNPYLNDTQKIRPAIGIAANQIGANYQMYYVLLDKGKRKHEFAFINPQMKVINSSSFVALKNGEGCLSVKKAHPGLVPRNLKIEITAVDFFTNNKVSIKAQGILAIVFQHEQKHLNGELFYELINTVEKNKIRKIN